MPPPETGFWEVAPDLVVEVVSPSDAAEEIGEKVSDYLTAGVRMIWVVYPRLKQVHVFKPGHDPRVLLGGAAITGDEVLPQFRLPLMDLWGEPA